jgi:hypothetical protein
MIAGRKQREQIAEVAAAGIAQNSNILDAGERVGGAVS